MTKEKSKVTTSVKFEDGKMVDLFDTYFLKDGSMIVKEKGEKYKHHHFYYDKDGKHCSIKKDEKIGQREKTNTNICDLRGSIIKKRGLLK